MVTDNNDHHLTLLPTYDLFLLVLKKKITERNTSPTAFNALFVFNWKLTSVHLYKG
jgi:hypothetical protein